VCSRTTLSHDARLTFFPSRAADAPMRCDGTYGINQFNRRGESPRTRKPVNALVRRVSKVSSAYTYPIYAFSVCSVRRTEHVSEVHRRSSCVALCRARIAHQPSRVMHMQFNSTHARGIIVHPTTMTTMTTTTMTTVRPMGWMRVVERRTSSIAHGDDHATKTTRRGAAQRRPTDDGRRTTHTTDDYYDGRRERARRRTGRP